MKVVFISNFINHHQAPLADLLYSALNRDFYFIETSQMPQSMKLIGYPEFSSRSYVIHSWQSIQEESFSYEVCESADVIIFSTSYSGDYLRKCYRHGQICFEVGERWFKKGILNMFSPRFLRWLYEYYCLYKNHEFYRLCSGAYVKYDVNLFGAYKDKCYKWGYFTRIDYLNQDSCFKNTSSGVIRIMWCARFLGWKHPELPIKLAHRLKNLGYSFVIDMFGSGEKMKEMKALSKSLQVQEFVNFCGNRPNDEILDEMRKHDIFLFTSDKNEGWGAVLNEAMANGCAVIASDEIGAAPFLIKDKSNGCLFKSRDLDDLEKQVIYLIENPQERQKISIEAYKTIKEQWSPQNAAKQLLSLIEAIKSNDVSLIPKSGPCSRA